MELVSVTRQRLPTLLGQLFDPRPMAVNLFRETFSDVLNPDTSRSKSQTKNVHNPARRYVLEKMFTKPGLKVGTLHRFPGLEKSKKKNIIYTGKITA